MSFRRYACLLLIIPMLLVPLISQAQTATPTETPPVATPEAAGTGEPIPRVHVVEEGENLTYIASLYDTTAEALMAVNQLTETSLLYVGQTLLIPGETGEVVVTTVTLRPGETLAGLAAEYNTTVEALAGNNRVIHPDQLIAGQTLTVVSRTGSAEPQRSPGQPHIVRPGETLLLLAARYRLSPGSLAAANDLPYPVRLYAGQRLRIPVGDQPYYHLPGEWVQVEIRPLPAAPGDTLSIYVENALSGRPTGELAGQPLRFTPQGDGYVALAGLDAFTEPGIHTIELEGSGDRPWQPLQEAFLVTPGVYATQYITVTEELTALLDPAVRETEDAFLGTIYGRYTEPQQWSGLFQSPVTTTLVTAGYGDARSYNSGPIEIFHTGIDYAGPAGTPILAPAAGTVVFNDTTELRGNIIILDHGLGVMTGYYHLSQSLVNLGEVVTAGQLIGEMGTTGLSSGVHLHWEFRIHNIPVNGVQWLGEQFP